MSQAMSCKSIVWKIGPFIDGELPPAEREEVAAHLAACKECVEMAVEFRALDARASKDRVPPVSGDEWARLWEGVLAGTVRASEDKIVTLPAARGARRWLLSGLAAAAAAAIFVAGIFVGSRLIERSAPKRDLVKEPRPAMGSSKDAGGTAALPPDAVRVYDDGTYTYIEYPNF